jgi:hypothetical protein
MKFISKALLLGVGLAAASSSAMAAFTFTNGDLILGFQATAGTGQDKNVYFNLGSGVGFRNNSDLGLLGNVSSVLSATYGSNWYSRSDVYFGVIGNLNSGPNPPAIGGVQPVNGDASRTLYVSAAASAPQLGTLRGVGTVTTASLASVGNFVSSIEGQFANMVQTANNTVTNDQQDEPGAWSVGWTTRNPVPGFAFGALSGGIQQNFGQVGSITYADIQRIVSTNSGTGVVAGVIGGGTYETTIAIGSDGSITALSAVPEVSSTLLFGAIGLSAAFQRRRKQLA